MGSTSMDKDVIIANLRQQLAKQSQTISFLRLEIRNLQNRDSSKLTAAKKYPNTSQSRLQLPLDSTQNTTPNRSKRSASEALTRNSDDAMEEDQPLSVPKKRARLLHKVNNFQNLLTLVMKDSPKNSPTNTKTLANGNVKVITQTDDKYRCIIHLLREAKYEYHHYQLKSKKAFRIVVRGLHPDTCTLEIKKELESLGHMVRNITNI